MDHSRPPRWVARAALFHMSAVSPISHMRLSALSVSVGLAAQRAGQAEHISRAGRVEGRGARPPHI